MQPQIRNESLNIEETRRRLFDVEKWEGQLREDYQCGGPTIPEGTKVLIAMGILPASTGASIRFALKGINDFAQFKDTLRDNIRFLEEHGGTWGSHAHILQDAQGNSHPTHWTSRNRTD